MVLNRSTRRYLRIVSSLVALLIYGGVHGEFIFRNSFEGTRIVVTSADDSGPGTLRQAMLDAQDNDFITFDPTVFPPHAPATIFVDSELPDIWINNLTLDASNAGVILDGSNISGNWGRCLKIVSSQGSVIRGLRITNFTGPAVELDSEATNSVIGGDRTVGSGPFGQGNQLINSAIGVNITARAGANHNVIQGNLMGTDAAGVAQWGNERSGVWIADGANGNIIGPDNVIAYNGQAAIIMQGVDTRHNTVTQNSIHDNAWPSIDLSWEWPNERIPFPGVFAFDLEAGTISGATCPLCTVEIFSDDSDEGAIFEGSVTADDGGAFAFIKGSAFAGLHLTTTATDASGNTSMFSPPTSGDSGAVIMQTGNNLAMAQFRSKLSAQLPADNRLGSMLGITEPEVDALAHLIYDPLGLGAKILETSMQEGEEPIDWSLEEFKVTPQFDEFIDDLIANGVAVNYAVNFWDKAGHRNGEVLDTPRFQTEDQILDFLDYVRFVVSSFKGRVQYYTIWTEPDGCGGSYINCILPNDYVNLLRRTVPVIHEEDPAAKVSMGPVVLFHARDYLDIVLNSDVMPLLDVIQWHGIYDVTPDSEVYGTYYYDYPLIMAEIKQTAAANGFTGEYWGSELGLSGPGDVPPDDPDKVPIETWRMATKYKARFFMIHLAVDIGVIWGSSWLGKEKDPRLDLSYRTEANLNTLMNNARSAAISATITSEATNIASYGFSLPNGDWLFALWTDGVAEDHDPGVPTTITFPGLAGHMATGVDVLHGFEQPVIASEEDGNLVIHDLLVKDYPILLRLTPAIF
jgi:hypothetical protein